MYYLDLDINELGLLCSSVKTKSKELNEIYDAVIDSDINMKSHVLSLIASNPNADINLLTKLKDSNDILVRASAIGNINAPKEWRTEGGRLLKQSNIKMTGFDDIFGG